MTSNVAVSMAYASTITALAEIVLYGLDVGSKAKFAGVIVT